MAGLSKSRIILHRQCPKRLWLYTYHPELAEEDAGVTARLNAGHRVGDIARELYPSGILIDTLDSRQALSETEKAIAEAQLPVFEAAFAADGVLIRADLLLPVQGGYRLIEVKSSTSVKGYHLEDASVQSWVAAHSGLPIKSVELAHIDTSFVYPGNENYDGLFAFEDISANTQFLAQEVPNWIEAARATLACKEEPDIAPGNQCTAPFRCPFLGHCAPTEGENGFPPEILPHKSGKDLDAELRAGGYSDLRDVPENLITSPKHQRIWRVTKSGQMEVDPEAGEIVNALAYPRYYLDFETIQFVVPIWPGIRPYRQVPFQWSCHIEHSDDTVAHEEFLAEGSADPRRAFAESLIGTLKSQGPVFVYNGGFEGTRLKELAEDFPDLAPQLEAIRDRFIDLLPITRNHYYHRDMRGSWSLKAVLPTIAPELAYDDLDVADGGMAQDAYAEMLALGTLPERIVKLRGDLLRYCERDTWALVRVARFFEGR